MGLGQAPLSLSFYRHVLRRVYSTGVRIIVGPADAQHISSQVMQQTHGQLVSLLWLGMTPSALTCAFIYFGGKKRLCGRFICIFTHTS
jgi:hypothetical protein